MSRLLRQLAATAGTVLAVLVTVFLLVRVLPGDPVEVMLGERASGADRAALVAELGLDRPLAVQLGDYLQGLARLDLGQSLRYHAPVTSLIGARLPATLQLAGAALALALILALPLGVAMAVRAGALAGRIAGTLTLLGMALPGFWFGPLLILLFAVQLGWLPVAGRDGLASLALPALTLALGLAATLARQLAPSSPRCWPPSTCAPPAPRACRRRRCCGGTACAMPCCRWPRYSVCRSGHCWAAR